VKLTVSKADDGGFVLERLWFHRGARLVAELSLLLGDFLNMTIIFRKYIIFYNYF
jgi:energy-converting hydrogenase Eha subunit F